MQQLRIYEKRQEPRIIFIVNITENATNYPINSFPLMILFIYKKYEIFQTKFFLPIRANNAFLRYKLQWYLFYHYKNIVISISQY